MCFNYALSSYNYIASDTDDDHGLISWEEYERKRSDPGLFLGKIAALSAKVLRENIRYQS
jgi:hypothetical protein